jgi:hypothetical protein
MTNPSTPPPSYLQEAADELRAARDANDRYRGRVAEMRSYNAVAADALDAETADRSMEIAAAFTRLAAIEAGLPPCCHHAQPGQEPQP